MISMTGNTPIFFQGEARNAAFLNITSFGPIDPDAYDDMTDVVCVLLEEELGIDPVNVNIVYNETVNWGWNGSNL